MSARFPRGYTVEEAATITGVKPSTIRYWLGPYGRKTVTAEVADTGRQGSRKLLSLRNLVQIRVAYLASAARFSQAQTAHLLRKAFTRRKLEWYTPGQSPFGKVEWLFLADRPAWAGGRFWELKSIGARGTPGQADWLGAALSAHLGDFEVMTFEWPDGWKPVTELDRQMARDLFGVRRLTVINLGLVKHQVGTRV